jgi:hypothetical protein
MANHFNSMNEKSQVKQEKLYSEDREEEHREPQKR